MNVKELIKKLVKSKTIQGIAVAAFGAAVNYVKPLLTPEFLAQHNLALTILAAGAQTCGLSLAALGRLTAAGPLLAPPVDEKPSFDGTGGELQ